MIKRLREIPITNWSVPFPLTKLNNLNNIECSIESPIESIEQGQILFFPALAFPILPEEMAFFSERYVDSRVKNISLNPHTGLLRCANCTPIQYQQLKNMLKRFSINASELVNNLFPHYSGALETGRTSFRPVEIAGRHSSYRKDDTRLHVDAFPSSPNQGKRILRVFSNINLSQPRHWRVGEPFIDVAKRFLPHIKKYCHISAKLLKMLKVTKSYRTEYDHIMLQIHNKMKFDEHYQTIVQQENIYFPAQSSWIVQTDQVSHAAMSGQHVLEQTFYLPVEAMKNPALSPLKILEKLVNRKLI